MCFSHGAMRSAQTSTTPCAVGFSTGAFNGEGTVTWDERTTCSAGFLGGLLGLYKLYTRLDSFNKAFGVILL